MARNFIDRLLDYTKYAESPTSYFKWCGYAAIAAVLRDNVWLELPGLPAPSNRIYPNIYVILHSSQSSITRKSVPMKVALALVRKVGNTHVIAGRSSIQGTMDELSMAMVTADKTQIKGASGILYSEEMSAFFVDVESAVNLLTNLYDYHEIWEDKLRGNVTKLHNVCLTLLMATNEELIRDIFQVRAVKGGLLARSIIVSESRRRHKNSLMFGNGEIPDPQPLHDHLRMLSQKRGAYEITKEARDEYDTWYNSLPDDISDSETGFEGRIHTTILKIALLIAASDGADKVITQPHIEEAIQECTGIYDTYKRLSAGVAQQMDKGTAQRHLMSLMLSQENFSISYEKILFKLYMVMDKVMLEEIIATWEAGGICQQVFSGEGTTIRLTAKAIRAFTEVKEKQR